MSHWRLFIISLLHSENTFEASLYKHSFNFFVVVVVYLLLLIYFKGNIQIFNDSRYYYHFTTN